LRALSSLRKGEHFTGLQAVPTPGFSRFSIRSLLRRVAPFCSKVLSDRKSDREKASPPARALRVDFGRARLLRPNAVLKRGQNVGRYRVLISTIGSHAMRRFSFLPLP
jgi:hypothetical protein